jgi:hypothetical protein
MISQQVNVKLHHFHYKLHCKMEAALCTKTAGWWLLLGQIRLAVSKIVSGAAVAMLSS